MENSKHLPLPLCFSLTKKANSLKKNSPWKSSFRAIGQKEIRIKCLPIKKRPQENLRPHRLKNQANELTGGYCAKYALFAPSVPEYL